MLIKKQKTENLDKLKKLTESFAEHGEEISAIAAVLNNSEDVCYIANVKTYELLWANNITKKLFGKNIIGMKCYKALQNSDTPCDFCTNVELKDGEVYKWVYYNPIVKKHYLIKDRLIKYKGKLARFEQAIEIGDVHGRIIL